MSSSSRPVAAEPTRPLHGQTVRPYTLLWLAGGLLALVCALLVMPASYVDGHYIPVGNDSFYHARRILDAVANLSSFYEFDPKIHAPEGSLVVWPWGYDFGMALLTKLVLAVTPASDPMGVMVFIPPAAVFLAMAALVGILKRTELSLAAAALVVACFALSPLTQMLHSVGSIDHHYVEFILWLAVVWALLRWLGPSSSRSDALLVGGLMAIAPAFHTDLFILQIPFVATLTLVSLRRMTPPLQHVKLFALVLCAGTLLVAIPSLPFRQGRFEFFTLSWFHVYAAFATAAFSIWVVHAPVARRSVFATIAVGALLAVPGMTQTVLAGSFVAGDLAFLGTIEEAHSPFALSGEHGGFLQVSGYYSLLLWISPLVFVGCLLETWKARQLEQTYFWIACALGLGLLMAQFRFNYFGSLGLIVPPLIWAERAARRYSVAPKTFALGAALVLAIAYAPPLMHQLFKPWVPGSDPDYALTRGIYPSLAQTCSARPGTVLANSDDGHYIRFHTECSVIANNFIITRQHEQKLREVAELLDQSAADLAARDVPASYVLVHLRNLFTRDASGKTTPTPMQQVIASNPRLVVDLVLSPPEKLPPAFELLDEQRFSGPDGHPYVRLFRVDRSRK